MEKVICWLLILGGIYYVWQAGWFNGITEYFSEANKQAREEKVIHYEEGNNSTVKYKNVFDLIFKK